MWLVFHCAVFFPVFLLLFSFLTYVNVDHVFFVCLLLFLFLLFCFFRHHKYPFDYAASEFGVSTQFNPTKILIDLFAAFGLVTNRKRAVGAWAKLKERRDNEEIAATAAAAGGAASKTKSQ